MHAPLIMERRDYKMSNIKMKGLFKGLKYISQILEEEKEEEMKIGFPTDVKHVAHVGWDGPSSSVDSPSWMDEYKSPSSGTSEIVESTKLRRRSKDDSSENGNVKSNRSKKSSEEGDSVRSNRSKKSSEEGDSVRSNKSKKSSEEGDSVRSNRPKKSSEEGDSVRPKRSKEGGSTRSNRSKQSSEEGSSVRSNRNPKESSEKSNPNQSPESSSECSSTKIDSSPQNGIIPNVPKKSRRKKSPDLVNDCPGVDKENESSRRKPGLRSKGPRLEDEEKESSLSNCSKEYQCSSASTVILV